MGQHGKCHHCGGSFGLNTAGNLRQHDVLYNDAPIICAGSGWPPCPPPSRPGEEPQPR